MPALLVTTVGSLFCLFLSCFFQLFFNIGNLAKGRKNVKKNPFPNYVSPPEKKKSGADKYHSEPRQSGGEQQPTDKQQSTDDLSALW